MRSMFASPEFDSEAEVNLWTRKHKATEPMYDLLKKIIDHCTKNNIQLENDRKDMLDLGRQLVEQVDGKKTTLHVIGGSEDANDGNRLE